MFYTYGAILGKTKSKDLFIIVDSLIGYMTKVLKDYDIILLNL